MRDDLYRKIENHLAESARVKRAIFDVAPSPSASSGQAPLPGKGIFAVASVLPAAPSAPIAAIAAAAELIVAAFEKGGKLLLCGNGGSAADCQHMAAEFVSKLKKTDSPRRALPALALTTDTSFLTAYANDEGVENIFSRQIEALGRSEDVLIAISTSGNSPNILRAVDSAREAGLKTIALTGRGGRLGAMADVSIAVPSTTVAHIQEAHLAIEHVICELVEDLIFCRRETTEGAI